MQQKLILSLKQDCRKISMTFKVFRKFLLHYTVNDAQADIAGACNFEEKDFDRTICGKLMVSGGLCLNLPDNSDTQQTTLMSALSIWDWNQGK
jgi:hypothetical protein